MTSKRIDLKDKDSEKKLKNIMKKKIKSCMREKGLLDSTDVIMDPLFTKEIMAYPNTGKFKPLSIDL